MGVITRPAQATHDLGGTRFTSLATPSRGSAETSVWAVEIDPGTPATPHSLTREEVFVVLDGVAATRVGEVDGVAETGDAIVVPAGVRLRDRQRRRGAAAPAVLPARRRSGRHRRRAVHPAVGPVGEPVNDVPLARLLAVAYRQLIDGLHDRLRELGWDDVRPSYGFVLLTLRDREASVSDLAALMGVSKQATSKLLDQMAEGAYVSREASTSDARQVRVALAPRGRELLGVVEAIYAELESEWAAVVGAREVARLRKSLTQVVLSANAGSFPEVRPGP